MERRRERRVLAIILAILMVVSLIFPGTGFLSRSVVFADGNDITDFLKGVDLYEAGSSTPKDVAWLIDSEKTYGMHVNFAESDAGNVQFHMDPDNRTFTYAFPAGVKITQVHSPLTILINDSQSVDGTTYTPTLVGDHYEITGTFADDASLRDSRNVKFYLDFDVQFDEGLNELDFGNNIKIPVQYDTESKVTVAKTGFYSTTDGKAHFTVTVNSKRTNHNVKVKDTLTGTAFTGLTIDSITSGGADCSGSVTSNVTAGGFDITIPTMTDGQSVVINYSVDIDYSKISENGTGTETGNTVDVTSNEDPDPDPVPYNLQNKITYTNLGKGASSSSLNADGSKTITYTVNYNDYCIVPMNGVTLTDTINSTGITYPADLKLNIARYGKNGSLVSEEQVSPASLSDTEWTYQLNDTTPYKYVITYEVTVPATEMTADKTINNTIEDGRGHKGTTGITVGPEALSLTKSVADVDTVNKEISWKLIVTVPKDGLGVNTTITDSVPTVWVDGTEVVENLVPGSLTLLSNTTGGTLNYSVAEDADQKKFVITFPDGIANTTGTDQTIEFEYNTVISDAWVAKSATETWMQDHTNNAEIRSGNQTGRSSATAKVVPPTIKKNSAGKAVDGSGYPVYKFEVVVANPTVPLILEDSFDPELELVTTDTSYANAPRIYSGDQYYQGNNETAILPGDISTGEGSFRMSLDQSYIYGTNTHYRISYALKVKSVGAYRRLAQRVADSGNEKITLTNTAKVGEVSDDLDFDFEYAPITKSLTNPEQFPETGEGVSLHSATAQYQVVINPLGLTLNNGDPMTATDTFTNLAINYTTISFEPADAGITCDAKGNVVTITNIPDATPVTMTYSSRVSGEAGADGKLTVRNEFETSGHLAVSTKSFKVKADAGGTGSIRHLNIFKYEDGNLQKRLQGASFKMYDANKNPMKWKAGSAMGDPTEDVVVTTNQNGIAVISQYDVDFMSSDDTHKNVYYLKEVKAPTGYMIDETWYQFMLIEGTDPDYTQFEYVDGDILKIRNYKPNIYFTKVNENDEPLAGAEFTLYDESKTSLGVTAVSDAQGNVSFADLPVAATGDTTFYIKETAVSDPQYVIDDTFYKVVFSHDAEGNLIEKSSDIPARFRNTKDEPKTSVTLEKVLDTTSVAGTAVEATVKAQTFPIDFVLTAPAGKTIPASVTAVVTKADSTTENRVINLTNNAGTIELASGESAKISGLPRGTEYVVTEAEDQTLTEKGYDYDSTAVVNGYSGTISNDGTTKVTVTNGYDMPKTSLKVSKIWDDENNKGAVRPDDISVQLNKAVTGATAVTPVGNAVVLNTANNWSCIWNSLDKYDEDLNEITYSVVETSETIRELSVWYESGNPVKITDPLAANSYTITNTLKTGDLEVSKEVISPVTSDSNTEFNFTVTLDNLEVNGTYGEMTFANGVATFTLKDGESKSAVGLPQSMGYTVTESADNDFNVTKTGDVGNIGAATSQAVFTNTRKTGKIKVTKEFVFPSDVTIPNSAKFDLTFQVKRGDTVYATFTWMDLYQILSTGGNGYVVSNLPLADDYKLVETNAAGLFASYNLVIDETASTTTVENIAVTEGSTTDVPLTNTYKKMEGSILLKAYKTVNGSAITAGSDYDAKFSFELADAAGLVLQTKSNAANVVDFDLITYNEPGVHTYKITEKTVTGMPDITIDTTEFTITVTVTQDQTDPSKLTAEVTNAEKTTAAGTETITYADGVGVTFNNIEAKKGDLEVSKTVVSDLAADADQYFGFTVTLDDTTITGTYGDVSFDQGVASFELKNGQQKTATGLPEGVGYTVTETADNGFTTTKTGNTGTISETTKAEAEFTNTRKTGGLKVSKEVVSSTAADKQKDFVFTVTLSDTTITGTYGGMTFTNGVATFTLKDGQTKTATGLPISVGYTVTEQDVAGFVTTYTGNTGSISTTTSEAKFTNTKDEGGLVVAKTVVSDIAADHQKDFAFKVTLDDATVNGTYGDMEFNDGIAEFTLKDGEIKSATGLAKGIGFTVEETADTDFTTTKTGETGAIDDAAQVATFTNTRKTGDIEVSKTVVSDLAADADQNFTFTVTLSDTTITGIYGGMNFDQGVASFELKGGEKKTATGLPKGISYTVTETAENGFTTTKTGDTGSISETTKAEAKFTNTRKTGDLKVTKTVVSSTAADKQKDFEFTVTLADTTISGTYGGMTFANGVATFPLKDGETKSATGLPVSVGYTVIETTEDGFTTSKTGDTGNIGATVSTAAFTNKKEEGGLIVKKIVLSDLAADDDQSFDFTVTLGDNSINGTYGEMTFTNGVATFTLKDGETKSAVGLPKDVTYTVTETANDDFITSKTGDTGSIGDTTVTAEFTNTRKTGNLEVSKTVVSDLAEDADQNFDFTVTLADTTISGTYGEMTFTSGVATFTLKDGETKTATGLPISVAYTVTETANTNFTTTKTGDTGSIGDTAATAAFTNTRKTGDLKVSKDVVSSTAADKQNDFEFTVTLADTTISGTYGDMTFLNGVATFTLKDGEFKTATGLPISLGYTVNEQDETGFVATFTGNTGTIATTISEAKFTNTKDEGGLVVSKTVVSDIAADHQKDFAFKVTLDDATLNGTYGDMDFTNGVAEFTLKDGETKSATGLAKGIGFTVEETADADFTTTKTGETGTIADAAQVAAFTNTRKTGDLEVSKKVVSALAADADLNFDFTVALDDLTINGTFGDMTFANGVATFTLKDGETKSAVGLPKGITYTVTETENTDFTTTKTGDTGSIGDTAATAEFTNTRKNNEGTLKITKTISGDVTPEEAAGQLQFTITDETGEVLVVNGKRMENLILANDFTKNGDIYELELTVPAGQRYVVSEVIYDVDGAILESVTANGVALDKENGIYSVLTEEVVAGQETVTAYEDNYKKGNLKITKTIKGAVTPEEAAGQLEFTITNVTTGDVDVINLTQFDFDQTTGEYTYEIEARPGDVYTVTETDYDVDGAILETVTHQIMAGDIEEGATATGIVISSTEQTKVNFEDDYKADEGVVHFTKYGYVNELCSPLKDEIQPLKGVVFRAENINNDLEFYLAQSNEDGLVEFMPMPAGTYKIWEVSCPEEYQLDDTVYYVTIANATVSDITTEDGRPLEKNRIINEPLRTDIEFTKVSEADQTITLEGSTYALFMESGDGSVALIAQRTTGKDGKVVFEGVLPGRKYSIKEMTSPDGYYVSKNTVRISFKVVTDGQGKPSVTIDDTSIDNGDGTMLIDDQGNLTWLEPVVTAKITKVTKDGKLLPGATLRVEDEEGNVVIPEWVTGEAETEISSKLIVGKTYRLVEVKAPDGYALADPVKFTVSNDEAGPNEGRVIKVSMIDEKLPPDTPPDVPKTSDDTPLLPLAGLMTFSLAGVVIVGTTKKKMKKRNKK